MRWTIVLAAVAGSVGFLIGWFVELDGLAGAEKPAAHGPTVDRPATVRSPQSTINREAADVTGEITGRVLAPDGTPIDGVEISAIPNEYLSNSSPREFANVDEVVQAAVARHAWTVRERRTTQTDFRGNYRLTGISDTAYHVRARKQSHDVGVKRGQSAWGVRSGERVDFVAFRNWIYTLDVRLPDGTPPASADISIGRMNRSRRTLVRWTPDKPTVTLSSGVVTLAVTAGEHDEFRTDEDVRIVTGKTSKNVRLTLRGRNGIRGRVIFPVGWTVESLRVFIGPAAGFDPSKLRRFGRAIDLDQTTRSYVKFDVPPGRYVIVASLNGSHAIANVEVDVGREVVEQDLRVESLGEGKSRVVRVLAPDGSAVTDVGFGFRYDGSGGGSGGCSIVERGDGSFLVRPMDHPLGDDVKYTLSIGSREYGVLWRSFVRSDPSELTVQFPEPSSVYVTVENLVGSEHEGHVFVHVQPAGEHDGQRHDHVSQIGRAGVKLFSVVPSGEAEILIGVNNGRSTALPTGTFWLVARKTVTLQPGENRVSVQVPRLYPLRVERATGKRSYVESKYPSRVLLQPTDPRRRGIDFQYINVPVVGEVTIPRLAAGVYEISGYIRSEKRTWKKTITVPRDRVVTVP